MDQQVAGIHIWKVPWLQKRHRPWGTYSSEVTKTTLVAWDRVAYTKGLTTFPSPLSPITSNADFSPGLKDQNFKEWQDTNCKHAGKLYDLEGIISFEQLKRDRGLPETERHRYLQVRHWVMQPSIKSYVGRPLFPFEKWLVTKSNDKRNLSSIYAFLKTPQIRTKTIAQKRWERDLGRKFTHKEWEGLICRARTTAHSSAGKETWVKLLQYWYYTPERIHAWQPQRSTGCWRRCGGTGSLAHLLWHCPKLTRYWETILDDLDTVFRSEERV